MKSIAFVDGEQGVLDGLRRSMRKFRGEWTMDFFPSGEALLEAMDDNAYDIVVCDMKMPGMNGAETLIAVKERAPDTVRFILSGFAQQELIVESVRAAHQFLAKPIEAEALSASIDRALQMQSLLENPDIREMMASLHTLPTLPEIYDSLMREIASDDFSLQSIGEIVEKDVALSASLLRLVNSAFFGLVRTIDSPADAVTILGVDTVKNLALSSSVFESFEGSGEVQKRLRELNDMGQQMGILVEKFAARRKLPGARCKDHAQIAAMLCGLGELIEIQLSTQSQNGSGKASPSHEELAAFLLGIWAMPFPVLTAIRWHKQPSVSGDEKQYHQALVHAAWAMYTMSKESGEIDLESDTIDVNYLNETVGSEVLAEWLAVGEKLLLGEPDND